MAGGALVIRLPDQEVGDVGGGPLGVGQLLLEEAGGGVVSEQGLDGKEDSLNMTLMTYNYNGTSYPCCMVGDISHYTHLKTHQNILCFTRGVLLLRLDINSQIKTYNS